MPIDFIHFLFTIFLALGIVTLAAWALISIAMFGVWLSERRARRK